MLKKYSNYISKYKGVLIATAAILAALAGMLIINRRGKIYVDYAPRYFLCSECGLIDGPFTHDKQHEGVGFFICSNCGQKKAAEALYCRDCDPDGKKPFQWIITMPKGMEIPPPRSNPPKDVLEAYLKAVEIRPVCPICKKYETVERYSALISRKQMEALQKKYNRNKNQSKAASIPVK